MATRFTITARDKGAWTNGIRVSIVQDAAGDATLPTGADTSFKPWTATVKYLPEKRSYSYRVRGGLLVTSPANGSVTVNHAQQTVTLEVSNVLLAEATFAVKPTLRDVAAWINLHTGWTAEVVGQGYYPTEVLNEGETAIGASARFIPAEEGLLAFLLNNMDPLVSMAMEASLANTPGALNAVVETNLTGGDGRGTDAMTSADLEAALALAATIEAHGLFIASADEALQALALAHCAAMNEPDEEKYRILFAGINFLGTSPVDGADATAASADAAVQAALARAQKLDGPCILGFNGSVAPNPLTGIGEQLGGLGVAAQALGMWAGARTATPLTNKPVVAESLEFPDLTRGQKEDLVDGGVLALAFDPASGRTKIVQAVTTIQTTNPSFRNLQGLSIQHAIARLWIQVLSRYPGGTLDLETGERIKADCAQALDRSILTGSNPNGFLTQGRLADGTVLPAWEGLTVVGDSTLNLWDIQVNAHPVGETDIIRVRTKLTPVPIEL